MGQRGPKPGSGGRPKKAIADKIADGNPGKRPLTVIDFKDSAADLEGQAMPKPSEFLSANSIPTSNVTLGGHIGIMLAKIILVGALIISSSQTALKIT